MQHSNESLVALKRELVVTTASPGWGFIKTFAEQIVREKERAAISEDDDTKGNALRREAKAARTFLDDLLQRVEKAKQFDAPNPVDETFASVVHEQGFEQLFV